MAGLSKQIIRQYLLKHTGLSKRTCHWRVINSRFYQGPVADASHEDSSQASSNVERPRYSQRKQARVGRQKRFPRSNDSEASNERRDDSEWFEGKSSGRTPRRDDDNDSDFIRVQGIDKEWFKGQHHEKTDRKHTDFGSSSKKEVSRIDRGWYKGKQHETHYHNKKDGDGLARKYAKKFDVGSDEAEQPTVLKPIERDKGEQEMLMIRMPEQPPNPHLLKVAIIGTPNVGKSTLINSLLGRRIFPVSEKVHTTRSKAFAVINQDNKQIIILDTPGIVDYKTGRRHKLARSLLTDHKNSLLEADLVAVLVDASQQKTKDGLHFEILKQLCLHPQLKSILIVNKVDMVKPRHKVLGITASLTSGMLGGESYEITQETAAKIGSLDKWSFIKSSFKPPVPDKMVVDNEDKLHKSVDVVDNSVVVEESMLDDLNVTDESVVMSRTEELMSSLNEQSKLVDDSESTVKSITSTSEDSVEDVILSNSSERTDIQELNVSMTEKSASHSSPEVVINSPDSSKIIPDLSDHEKQAIQLSKVDIMQDYLSSLQEVTKINYQDPESFEAANEEQRKKKEEEQEINKNVAEMDGWGGFDAAFVVSAKHGDGMRELKQFLLDQSTPRDWEYHDDVVTNLTPEEIVKEAIREQLLENLPEEIPYVVHQRNTFWGVGESGELKIMQDIVCQKKSQARMIQNSIGRIARSASQQIMDAFHCEVKLILGVVIEKPKRR